MSKTLGEEISEFRAKHKLDQIGFGKGCGYGRKAIQHIEKNRRNPPPEGFARIRKFLDEADDKLIASLRGPGPGNSLSTTRRGRKLTRDELEMADLRRQTPDELDDELESIGKRY